MAAADEPVELGQSIDERIQLVGLAGLTPPERCYHLLDNFIADFQNGGLWQYLQNQGEHATSLADACRVLGADELADSLTKIITIIGPLPTEVEPRSEYLDALDEGTTAAVVSIMTDSKLDERVDGLWAPLQQFAQRHQAEFLGPKTTLELWRSKHARGESAQPSRAKPIDLDAEAKRDASSTSRPCPACGQPCPAYRKSCKRCGFPLGRIEQ